MCDPQPANLDSSEPPRRLRLSGKASTVALALCFVATAVLIPMTLRLPRWIEYEIVLGAWWVIWLVILTAFLYGGQRVSDDHQLGQPRSWFASSQPRRARRDGSGWWDWLNIAPVGGDAEGCLIVFGIIIGAILLFGLIWFLVEIAIPVLFFLMYVIVRGMMAQVLNDRHRCRSNVVRAFAWAFVWATVYTAPLAGVVWFIHYVHQQGLVR